MQRIFGPLLAVNTFKGVSDVEFNANIRNGCILSSNKPKLVE